MSTDTILAGDDSGDAQGPDGDLEAQVELLAEENRRLRAAYQSAKRSRYRRTALGLLGVGAIALGGAALFESVRTILLALGGTGVFAAVLTYFLTPERFVSASVGDHIVGALTDNEANIVNELGLGDERVYVPTEGDARLFVPQYDAYEVPPTESLQSTFVVDVADHQRGLAFAPTGGRLYDEFERARAGPPADRPAALTRQLADAAVEQFELVARADPEDAGEGRLTIGVDDPVYAPVDRFDHPVASLFGVGLARGLNAPVGVTVRQADDDRYESLIVCLWSPEDVNASSASEAEESGEREAAASA